MPSHNELQRNLICSNSGSHQLIGKLNEQIAKQGGAPKIRVLTFRPSDIAYYGKFPFVSYLDPSLIPAYLAGSTKEIYQKLADLGVTHLFIPPYEMGEIRNSAFGKLIDEARYVNLEVNLSNYKLYGLRDKPKLLDDDFESSNIQVTDSAPLNVDFSKVKLVDFKSQLSLVSRFHQLHDCDVSHSVLVEDEKHVISTDARRILTLPQLIEVDTSKAYRMSVDLRVTGDGPSSLSHIGLATYDSEENLQTSSPGTHRYGLVLNERLPADGVWRNYSGVFQGEGSETHNQFRPGTKFVAPILLVNYQLDEEATTTSIRNLVLEEVSNPIGTD